MSETQPPFSFDPASDSAALLNRIGLAVLGIAVPCLLVATRRPLFLLMPIGVALILAAAVLDSQTQGLRHLRNAILTPIVLSFFLFSVWCIASLAWDPFREEVSQRFFKVMGTLGLAMVAAAFLPERTKTSNLNLPPIGVAMAAILAFILALPLPDILKTTLDTDPATLQRGAIGLETLLWPVLGALALRERWNYCGGLAALVAIVALITGSQVALSAFIFGAVTFALTLRRPQQSARLVAGITAFFFLTAPLLPFLANGLGLAKFFNPNGEIAAFLHSLELWRGILVHDGWRIFTGHGLDAAFSGLLHGYLPPALPSGLLFEIWFDLGLPGILLAAAIAVFGIFGCKQMGPRLAPFMIAGLMSGLFIAMTDISISQLWWVNVVGIAGIAITHIVRGQYLTSRPKFRNVTQIDENPAAPALAEV